VRNVTVWLVWPERSPAVSQTSPESSPASAVDVGQGPHVSVHGISPWLDVVGPSGATLVCWAGPS
jgi:hypothetical protein